MSLPLKDERYLTPVRETMSLHGSLRSPTANAKKGSEELDVEEEEEGEEEGDGDNDYEEEKE